ncbi:hypothetical protein [Sphingomonas sp. dw_22]|uniref:hypothetical protein n=1 Tax=Sphingomonas sp. dw_22 TaxID=2721175 RepID=UPI001BD6713C|nr:hypothetical protein [Sphingomonas sp. dw_22]
MAKLIQILLLSAAAIAVPAGAAQRDTPEAKLQKMLTGRVEGPAVDCINLSTITSSQIIDGKAIVYRSGGKLYVNEPRSGADSLNDDDILVTRTFSSQLCSVDTVRLIDRTSRFPRGFVLLGKFVPYTKPKAAN